MNADTILGANEKISGAIEAWWDNAFGTPKGITKGLFRETVGYVQEQFGKTKTAAIRDVKDFFKVYGYIQNNWDHYVKYAKKHWSSTLTEKELTEIAGDIKSLVNALANKYGSAKEAKNEIVESIKSLSFEKWKRENHEAWKETENDIDSIEKEADEMLKEVDSISKNMDAELVQAAKDAGININDILKQIEDRYAEIDKKAQKEIKEALKNGTYSSKYK